MKAMRLMLAGLAATMIGGTVPSFSETRLSCDTHVKVGNEWHGSCRTDVKINVPGRKHDRDRPGGGHDDPPPPVIVNYPGPPDDDTGLPPVRPPHHHDDDYDDCNDCGKRGKNR